jgi:cytoskeletal protein RodZ
MTKYLAMVAGAAIAIAATFSHAQTPTPPSTDRKSGSPGEASSAQPNPDKKGGAKTGTPKTGGTPTPPSTDRPAGSGDATSAKPKPDKK